MKYEVLVMKDGQWDSFAQFKEYDWAIEFCGYLFGLKARIIDLATNECVMEYDEYH